MARALPPLRRQRNVILIALAVLAAGAWAVLLWQAGGVSSQGMGLTMGMDAALFLGVWIPMMVAMMFPAAAPMILLFAHVQAGKRQQGRVAVPTWLFTATYLLVWSVVGALAYAGAIVAERVGGNNSWIMSNGQHVGEVVLMAAGLYQVTPLNRAFL